MSASQVLEPIYVAGPMTGYPQFNFPAFIQATGLLRGMGLKVISPHELDSPEIQAESIKSLDGKIHGGKIGGETWGQIIARDIRIVADEIKTICLLENWHKSKGAKLEVTTGLVLGHKFCKLRYNTYLQKHTLETLDKWHVAQTLASAL